jgi:methionyl-tRNA formyltransferase
LLKIAVASSASVGIPVLTSLLASRHEIQYVVSNPEKATGRGQKTIANEFAQHANEVGLTVHSPLDSFEILGLVNSNPVELVVTIAYGQLIKAAALSAPRYGWLNIHFSQLPQFRGAAPVQYAIMNEQTQTGVSIFQLDAGMDTGPVYEMWNSSIELNDTTETLLKKLSEESALRIVNVLDSIESGRKPIAQSETGASLAPKISKSMGKLSLDEPRSVIAAKVRALGNNPGTFITFRGERLGISEAEISYADDSGVGIGELVANKNELLLKLGDGFIRLVTVIPQGKKRMSGGDFARGARLSAGESCE